LPEATFRRGSPDWIADHGAEPPACTDSVVFDYREERIPFALPGGLDRAVMLTESGGITAKDVQTEWEDLP
jgi:hypothetical protein